MLNKNIRYYKLENLGIGKKHTNRGTALTGLRLG